MHWSHAPVYWRAMSETPRSILQRVFGYHSFRGEQEAIIDTLLQGDDALVLMPTGGGKSLCYQIPALLRAGTAIVISPLISLMQDQVDALHELGVAAAVLNSSRSQSEQAATEQALLDGELDLLYMAPERLTRPRTLALLHRSPIALFAIDEAHCVSQWGHDFRSDYLELERLAGEFPQVPRVALTATAEPQTRAEIARRLHLDQARHFISSFDRPNIRYRITRKDKTRQQLLALLRREHPGDAGIVYCLSRNKVEATAAWLQQQGLDALPYHAGLPAEQRRQTQQRFLYEDGIIIVATIAFGMGIDKPDVRFVAHLDLPKSIEGYYQETGRAGRDGEPATAWLAYGLEDVIKLRQMLEGSGGSEEHKRRERLRLDAMLGLCELTACRRQALLQYFGEHDAPERCDNCDACLHPAPTRDATEDVRKALSCVYRTGQRFGVNHVIDVLRGGDTTKIRQFNHQNLSTWGIGRHLSTRAWRSIFRQLVARGLLRVDPEGFGALHLTEACRPVLRGEENIRLREDVTEKVSGRPRREASTLAEADQPLWQALRGLRKRLAERDGVPPYAIFNDHTLREMVASRPLHEPDLLRITGVGETKLARFGSDFLELIREFEYPDVESTS